MDRAVLQDECALGEEVGPLDIATDATRQS